MAAATLDRIRCKFKGLCPFSRRTAQREIRPRVNVGAVRVDHHLDVRLLPISVEEPINLEAHVNQCRKDGDGDDEQWRQDGVDT